MSVRSAGVLILLAPCLIGLGGCSSSAPFGGLTLQGDHVAASAPAPGAKDITGSVTMPAAEATGGNLTLAKKYFRTGNFSLAAKEFRAVAEAHPRDAEAWVELAAAYDRLNRFDLADAAYEAAIRIVGPTVEILNDQGHSFLLRGDYASAQKKLQEAEAKDPANPYVESNIRLLGEAYEKAQAMR